MPLSIEIVSTYTYTYSKHFLSVTVFVDLWIFPTRVADVYVTSSTFHLKRREFLQTISFRI